MLQGVGVQPQDAAGGGKQRRRVDAELSQPMVSARQADAMPPIQDQITKASSSNATAIRWFTGSSTASS
jgi:hypothetical protein